MIYLELFLTFLQIGTISFGGGYGMISLIREECLARGWLTEEALMNFIAVAESTPGPIAVNMATFVGSSQAGFFGSLIATLGVILPSFMIILLIAALFKNLMKLKGIQGALYGIKPVVIGLILSTAVTLFLSNLLGLTTVTDSLSVNGSGLVIFACMPLLSLCYRKVIKKSISPIILILFSAVLGIAFYGFT